MFGDVCDLDKVYAVSVFTHDYRVVLFSSCPIPIRVALSDLSVLGNWLCSTGKVPGQLLDSIGSFSVSGLSFGQKQMRLVQRTLIHNIHSFGTAEILLIRRLLPELQAVVGYVYLAFFFFAGFQQVSKTVIQAVPTKWLFIPGLKARGLDYKTEAMITCSRTQTHSLVRDV